MVKVMVVVAAILVIRSGKEVLATTTKTKSGKAVELCGTETEIELTKGGDTSSKMITLTPPPQDNSFCKLRVTAPKTHVINMQFIEGANNELLFNNTEKHPPCVMSIFLPDNRRIPVWKGDLCSKNALNPPELLTSDFKIMWNPPTNPSFTKGRKFVITAVGRGPVCKEAGQHTCMRIGWDPILCVSDYLTCDGIVHCPKTSTTSDEDEKECSKAFFSASSLEQLAVEILRKWKPSSLANRRLYNGDRQQQEHHSSTPKQTFRGWREWKGSKKTEIIVPESETKRPESGNSTSSKAKATDSISQVLSKYGPWGYLMLGMLICGTVLMFCGLWECCFRKPKADVDGQVQTSSQHQPTTVLIIGNRPEDGGVVASPPNYDELDQPPSYTTLFPNFKNQQQQQLCSTSSNNVNNSNNDLNDSVVSDNATVGDHQQTQVSTISSPNQQHSSANET